ncbi:hypothetical protein TbrSNM41_16750 [Thermus brockianus]|uniref:Secreted protein n=1 Tax=Thermus brockianus TaxID=56956 RepID=A0ABM7XKT9_THEBO|nr:hypothetical protein TbrSNM41_16750 [Thermus brockianus]
MLAAAAAAASLTAVTLPSAIWLVPTLPGANLGAVTLPSAIWLVPTLPGANLGAVTLPSASLAVVTLPSGWSRTGAVRWAERVVPPWEDSMDCKRECRPASVSGGVASQARPRISAMRLLNRSVRLRSR